MHKRAHALATAAALAISFLAAEPALAEADATVTISGMKFQLIDLNPGDGIAAGISWVAGGGGSSSGGSVYDYDTAQNGSFSKAGAAFSPLGGKLTLAHGGVTSKTGARGLSLSGWVQGPGGPNAWGNYFSTGAGLVTGAQFVLTPYTLLVWTADYAMDAKTTVGQDQHGYEYATAQVNMQLSGPAAGGGTGGAQQSTAYQSLYASSTFSWDPVTGNPVYAGQELQLGGKLGTSFANLTGTSMAGFAVLNAGIYGNSATGSPTLAVAVPEPATGALALAGLAVVGGIARRRKRA